MTEEERKAKRRAYYQKNRKKISAANYAYFLAHKDEINAKRRERYVNDPEYREKMLENVRRYHREQRAYLKGLRERKAAEGTGVTDCHVADAPRNDRDGDTDCHGSCGASQ